MPDKNPADLTEFEIDGQDLIIKNEELQAQFGAELLTQVSRQISQKQEIEKRWLDDVRHFNGLPDSETQTKISAQQNKNASTVFVNLTRSKTNNGESKLGDLVLPTDDRNWGIQPTPVPELSQEMKNSEKAQSRTGEELVDEETGEPITKGDIAKSEWERLNERSDAMQREMDDQLVECSYNAGCRDVIHDACLLGMGVMKGPMVIDQQRKGWIEVADESGNLEWQMNNVVDKRPFFERVDPWNLFPDMSATCADDVEFWFERHMMTPKAVRKLTRRPGFNEDAIKRVLQSRPGKHRSDMSYLNELREINGVTQPGWDNRYEVWEYHGPIKKEYLTACGCDVDDENPLEEYEGVVWFQEHYVLKVAISMFDTDEAPYSIYNWERDEATVFGYGIPFRMKNSQRVMNASWRMILDNAGLSTGPQIVINRKKVEPANGQWELTPRKLWYLTKETATVGDAFGTFEIASHQNELSAIFQLAHQLADEETSLPSMPQGGDLTEQPAVMKTLGGTALWMSANNIMMRRAVKNFDDDLTVPCIRRLYHWNMQFNPKNHIKGDYEVDARGSSVLLVKEIHARSLEGMMAIAGSELYAPYVKHEALLRRYVQANQIPEDEVVKTADEIKADQQRAAKGPPPDPSIEIARMQEDTKRAVAEMSLQEKQIEAFTEEQKAAAMRELEMTKLAVETQLSQEEMYARFGAEREARAWDQQKFFTEIGVKVNQGSGI